MATRFSEMGSDYRDIRLNFSASTFIQRVYEASSLDKTARKDVIAPRRVSAKYIRRGHGSQRAQKLNLMVDLSGLVVFYDDVLGSGTIIQRRTGTFFIGNIVAGAIVESSMVNTSVAATGNLTWACIMVLTGSHQLWWPMVQLVLTAHLHSPQLAVQSGVYTPSATALG